MSPPIDCSYAGADGKVTRYFVGTDGYYPFAASVYCAGKGGVMASLQNTTVFTFMAAYRATHVPASLGLWVGLQRSSVSTTDCSPFYWSDTEATYTTTCPVVDATEWCAGKPQGAQYLAAFGNYTQSCLTDYSTTW